MATRRRYSPPKYRDGGAVPISADPVALASASLGQIEEEAAPVRADAPQPAPSPDDALRQAIEGQRRAEELQRQATQVPTVEQYVDTLPGLSDHKRAFLKRHPEMLQGGAREVMGLAYQEALGAGLADDSQELDRFLVETVREEMELRRQRLADAARSAVGRMTRPPPPDSMLSPDQGAERLMREAEAHMDSYHAEASTPLNVSDQIAAMAPPPTPQRRSMPMTAPVSREVPTASGRRFSAEQMTLTPEERQVARNSFSDPNLSNIEKERMYLANKIKLAQERAAGRYPMPERN